KALLRLWGAAKPLVERLALTSTVEDLREGNVLSSYQVKRALEHVFTSFALAGPGLRSLTLRLRMQTAVCFLSAEGLSIGDVAKHVGYGSTEAMAVAFRQAGLPPPTVVREALMGTNGGALPTERAPSSSS